MMAKRPSDSAGAIATARRLIPASGNDFGSVARGGAAEREFRGRVKPLLHPDFETVWPGEGSSTVGLEPTMEALHRVGRAFDRLIAVPELYVPLDDGARVLVLVQRSGTTFNGFDFAEPGAVIYDLEGRLLRRMLLFSHREPAFEEARITAEEAERTGLPSEG